MSAKKKKKKKKGLGVLKVLAALILLALLGFGAWQLWRANTAGSTTAVGPEWGCRQNDTSQTTVCWEPSPKTETG